MSASVAQLLADGRALSAEQMDNDLRALARDTRFCAVLGWLDRNREQYIRALSAQGMAECPGKMAHCAGSIHAVNVLAAQLAQLAIPARPHGETPPEDESG